jgi:hypothetical protein
MLCEQSTYSLVPLGSFSQGQGAHLTYPDANAGDVGISGCPVADERGGAHDGEVTVNGHGSESEAGSLYAHLHTSHASVNTAHVA